MKRMVALPVIFLLLVNPARLFAKGDTVKIAIHGANLKTPIQITDRKVLANIQVWSGLGTSSSELHHRLVSRADRPATQRPATL